jgi:uncharacterized protein involved in outer membrane biogenesis
MWQDKRMKRVRRLKKVLIGIGIFLVIFTLFGFFGLPPILKSVLIKQLSQNLHRDVTIREVKFNPYVLSLTVRDLLVKDRGSSQDFFSFEELYLNLQMMSVFRLAPVLKEITLKKPFFNVVRKQDLSYNFSDLMEKKEPKPEPKPGEKPKPFRFSLNNIRIENGSIDFSDEPVQKKHAVRDLNIGVPFISNLPSHINTFVQPHFSAKINDTAYAIQGKTEPFADSQETSIDININDLNIPYYLAYAPMKMNFKIPSAFLDTKTKLTFIRYKDRGPTLTISGDVALKKIAVDDPKNLPIFRLPQLDIAIAPSEPLLKKIHLAKVSVQSPELEIRRDPKGTINLETLFPEEKKAAGVSKQPVKPVEKAEPSAPLSVDVDEIELKGGKVSFSDLSTGKPFKTKIDPVDVKIDHFSNGKDKRTNYLVSLKTEANETVKLEGELSVDPMVVDGGVDVKSVPLKKYAPYYMDSILFDIEEGRLDLSTRYKYEKREKEPVILLSKLASAVTSLRLRKRDEKEDFFKVPVISLKETQVDLTKRELKLGSFFTEKGALTVTRFKNNEFDLQKLVLPPAPKPAQETAPPPPPPKAKEAEKPWVITVGQMTVDQYAVTAHDQSPSEPTTVLAEKIRFTGENISTAKNATGKVALSLLLDKKGTISTRGTIGIDPMKIEGNLEIKGIDLKDYAPYYKDSILFNIEEGDLGIATNYRYLAKEKSPEVVLSGMSISVERLRLKKRDEKEDFLTIPALSVTSTGLNLTENDLSIGEIATQKGKALVRRYKDGKLNLQTLFPEEGAARIAERPLVEGATTVVEKAQQPKKPWLVKVGKVSLDQYAVTWEDQSLAEPLTLTAGEIALMAENLSTAKGQKGNVSLGLRLDQKGELSAAGSLGMDPLVGDLKLGLKDISINSLQPYITDKAKIIVQDGTFGMAGNLSVKGEEGKEIQITYKGNSSITRLVTVDKTSAQDFLKWDSLSLNEMDVGYNPLYVHLNSISLTNFFSRIIIRPDGVMNVQDVMEGGQKSAGDKAAQEKGKQPPKEVPKKDTVPPKEQQAPMDMKVGTITLQGGHISFTDNHIKPNYSADLLEVGGRISGLSSAETQGGDLDLRGKLGSGAPLEITGKINPLSKDLLVDLVIRLKDIELSGFTPYSGRYVGYTIEKGKLGMELKYLIVKRQLDSQNKIFLDQFTLGDKVESPEATKLPVKLAISLLKDRKGEINLDIPVKGSLDDPKFSVFRIVLQVVGNLLVKAATSPFALIGAVMGGGQQMDYLEFDYGSAEIKKENEARVNTLIKVLQDRPGIKLDIEGHVDMEKDRDGLLDLTFQRKLKAQKLKEMVKKGGAPLSVDAVKIDPPEYDKYLKLAYKEEKFPKPKTILGFDKDIPSPEMQKLMLTHIEIKEDDLRQLARQRSAKVRDDMVNVGKIDPERIFVIEPKTLAPEKKEKLKDSRVDFKIK